MTLQGKAGKALGTACIASFFGGLLSCISLYFFAPILAQLAMKFGSPEYFWLSIFGLTIIAGVSSKSMVKGLISGALGLLLSTIGMDPMEGVQRFMFDSLPYMKAQCNLCPDRFVLHEPGTGSCREKNLRKRNSKEI